MEEIRSLFLTTAKSRNGVRWAFALALGLGQGEALGLQWSERRSGRGCAHDPPFSHPTELRPRLRRRVWEEVRGVLPAAGADEPRDRLHEVARGTTPIGLPAQLVTLLQHHLRTERAEHAHAGNAWHEAGWVFTTETGDAINPRTDWAHWKVLLREAGIRDGRLNDARHTAATVLLMFGVSQPTIMSIMGWSNPAMTQRYAHVIAPIRHEVARQVGGLLWPEREHGPQ